MTQHATITRETTTRPVPPPPAHDRTVPERPSALERMLWTHDGWGPLLMRLTLAVVFFAHGAQKAFGWFGGGGLGASMEQFSAMGLPGWLAVFVMLTELGGALLLFFGALTRLAALGIGAVMLGAIATVHLQYGFFMNWGGQEAGEGFEYHLLAIGLCLGLIASGGGRWSVDRKSAIKRQERRLGGDAPHATRAYPGTNTVETREETVVRRG